MTATARQSCMITARRIVAMANLGLYSIQSNTPSLYHTYSNYTVVLYNDYHRIKRNKKIKNEEKK
jgi:hypothetical protein